MYVSVPGKLSEIHSKVLGFSNPGDIIRFLVKLRDIFVPSFLHILGPCLLDWRTLGLWNVFLTVFQAPWHLCHSWKTLGTPLQCVVLLQSRGQCHDQCWNFMQPGSESAIYMSCVEEAIQKSDMLFFCKVSNGLSLLPLLNFITTLVYILFKT